MRSPSKALLNAKAFLEPRFRGPKAPSKHALKLDASSMTNDGKLPGQTPQGPHNTPLKESQTEESRHGCSLSGWRNKLCHLDVLVEIHTKCVSSLALTKFLHNSRATCRCDANGCDA